MPVADKYAMKIDATWPAEPYYTVYEDILCDTLLVSDQLYMWLPKTRWMSLTYREYRKSDDSGDEPIGGSKFVEQRFGIPILFPRRQIMSLHSWSDYSQS